MRASHLNALQSLLARDADAGALHTRHLLLLGAICAERKPVSLISAADLIDLSYEQTSRIVRRLIEAGMLERTFDPDDARRMALAPTRQGHALDDRVRSYVTAVSAAVAVVPATHTTEA
jgi:DNA-binding MarR family transcriptional regulator